MPSPKQHRPKSAKRVSSNAGTRKKAAASAPSTDTPIAKPRRTRAGRIRIIVMDHAVDLIEILGRDGIIEYVSPSITRLAGYQPAEVIGQHFASFVHPEDLAGVLHAFTAVLQTTEVVSVTLRYRCKDASWRTIEAHGKNYLEEPDVHGIVVHTRDVTALLQAETAARESERRFGPLTNALAEGVVVQDAGGAIIFCNPSAERILGLTADQMFGRTSVDPRWRAIHEDGSPFEGSAHPAMGTLRTGVPHSDVTMGIHRPDGTLSWISINTQPIEENRGSQPAGVISSFHDITQSKHAEEVLRKSAEEIADLYNNAPCGYHSLDKDGLVLRINDTELKWLGYTRDEVVEKMTLSDFMTPASQRTFERSFPQFVAAGWVRDLEYELVRKDGTLFPVLLSASAIKDTDGNYVMSRATLYDITELKRTEGRLHKVNRALRVLSDCNTALIHSQTLPGLLNEVCRLLVETGGFRMAWVGFAEHDEQRSVRAMAQHGYEAGYLAGAGISWGDTERGRGPTGTAIRTGTTQVNQSFLTNPSVVQWRAEAVARGFASSIALPLKDATEAFGALTIYASEADAFDSEEMALLEELADDLAFGIATLRTRAEHRQAEETVRRLAYFDPLTGIPNRLRLREQLERAIAEATTLGGRLALMMINVDRFSELHSGLGVRAADELLRQIASRLTGTVGARGMVARLSGDEFGVLLPQADEDQARTVAGSVRDGMNPPFEQAGISLDVQVSIGAALYPEHGTDPDALLLRSNIAAREARQHGTGYTLYTGATDQESPRRLALIGELRRAIEADQLTLFYQPKVDIRAGKVSGVEALVRWQHPERGMLPPKEFIELAEHTGIIKPLTYWVMNAAMRQCAAWRAAGLELAVAVNVSPSNLREPDFLDRMQALRRQWDIAPGSIQVEITETKLMEDPTHSLGVLARLREMGLQTFVDDFGTGYSSLSYIATLPLQALKIDRSFISNMMEDPQHATVVSATVSLAHSLGMGVVAEGVETLGQAQALLRLGCNEMQGYLFSKPLPLEQLEDWLASFSLQRFGLGASR